MIKYLAVLVDLTVVISCTSSSTLDAQANKGNPIDKIKYVDTLYENYNKLADVIAKFKLPLENFQLAEFKVNDSAKKILAVMDKPLLIEQEKGGVNDQLLTHYYYDGMSFQIVENQIFAVKTVRDDLRTPGGIHCGMHLDELKTKFKNVIFKDKLEGKVVISSSPDDFVLLVLLIRNGAIYAIYLRDAGG